MSEHLTRKEYRQMLIESEETPELDSVPYGDGGLGDIEYPEDITGPGLIARARKAFIGGTFAFAGSLAPLVIGATSDGALDFAGELVPALIIAAGTGIATGLTVYGVPNAGASSV